MKMLKKIKRSRIIILWRFTAKKRDFEEFAGHLLTMMIAEASRAFEQLPILKNAEILRNILYSGVWCRYEMIKEKRRQKAGEKADE